jgi:tetratricopeptide (TPR) repeat protein
VIEAVRRTSARNVLIPRLLGAVAVLSTCGAGAWASAANVPRTREWAVERQVTRITPAADSVWRLGPAHGSAYCDSLLRSARGQRRRATKAAIHVWRGRKLANEYRLDEGAADLDTAWALSTALRDSSGLTRVLIARAHGSMILGRVEVARSTYERVLPLARAAGLPELQGFVHRGLGGLAKNGGRYDEATRHLEAAIRLSPVDQFANRHSRFLLAEVIKRRGRFDEARARFEALLDEARQRGDRWLQAAVLNDLGNLEFETGDLAQADRNWAFAAMVFDSMHHTAAAINSRSNRAHALRHLGRWDEARRLLEQQIVEGAKIEDPAPRLGALGELATLFRRMGRTAQAEKLLREVRAASVDDSDAEESASLELAGLLREAGRLDEAERLVDSLLVAERRSRMTGGAVVLARVEKSATLRTRGRWDAALVEARAAERQGRAIGRESWAYWLDAAIELARVHRARGSADSAVAVLGRAARAWERWRSAISDLEWRERRGSGLATLFAEYGLALLDTRRSASASRRAREAFDALQAFQARTLEERMHGRGLSGRGMKTRIRADSLRRVLREGELLVDIVATPDTSFAFLVTRAGLAVQLLPGSTRLQRLHDDWRGATLSNAGPALVEAGLRRLAIESLRPLETWLRPARTVVFTGGGPIALWPLGAMTLHPETGPLGETREISTAPSATLWASLRARSSRTRATRGLLALGRTTDVEGRDLPGVRRELHSLASRYARVESRVNEGGRSTRDLTADLSSWTLLHFAAHAEAVTGSPWRSGFLLGRGRGDDAYLRASTVAGMSLEARLAVLSGCRSAGATTLAGEGALGLASAFLCSGATSVVATLWPVEDRVAERFMAGFYEALASGRTVAGAVADAQHRMRARSETADVRDWAAFVASGEGAVRVRLERRGIPLGVGR